MEREIRRASDGIRATANIPAGGDAGRVVRLPGDGVIAGDEGVARRNGVFLGRFYRFWVDFRRNVGRYSRFHVKRILIPGIEDLDRALRESARFGYGREREEKRTDYCEYERYVTKRGMRVSLNT